MQTCEMLVKTGRFVPNKPAELLASGYKELLEDKVPTAGIAVWIYCSGHKFLTLRNCIYLLLC